MIVAISSHFDGKECTTNLRVASYSFVSQRVSPAGLLASIRQGRAFTAPHNGRRRSRNFVSGQHLCLDFDAGTRDLSTPDEFIDSYASFQYTTPSHTPRHPRVRPVFVLSRPVLDLTVYEAMQEALVNLYPDNDGICRDGCRIYYGSAGCDANWYGNTLDVDWFWHEIALPFFKKKREKEEANRRNALLMAADSEGAAIHLSIIIGELLREVKNAPDGEKHQTLNRSAFVIGTYSHVLDDVSSVRDELVEIIASRPTVRDLNAAVRTIDAALRDGARQPAESVPLRTIDLPSEFYPSF